MKKRITIFSILFAVITTIISCKNEEANNEDLVDTVNKSGSIESSVTVEPLDSLHDILVTKHLVWYKGNQYKNYEHRDTLPALGNEMKTAENSEGETKNVEIKKDYEIFITVK